MRRLQAAILSCLLLGLTILIDPQRSFGQPFDLDTSPDSPLWWTLTDDLTPTQLRGELRSQSAHIERYRAAMEAGLAQPLSEKNLQSLSFYYNRQLTPALTPMWVAFVAFASAHIGVMGQEHVTEALTDFGFNPAPRAVILELGTEQTTRGQELAQELAEKSMEFVQIQRRAIEARGGDRKAYAAVKRAVQRGDLRMLLGSTDVSLATLSELRAAWLRHPISEVAGEILPELRSRLGAEDWGRFRTFLLEHVVPAMGNESKDFDYAQGVEE